MASFHYIQIYNKVGTIKNEVSWTVQIERFGAV